MVVPCIASVNSTGELKKKKKKKKHLNLLVRCIRSIFLSWELSKIMPLWKRIWQFSCKHNHLYYYLVVMY